MKWLIKEGVLRATTNTLLLCMKSCASQSVQSHFSEYFERYMRLIKLEPVAQSEDLSAWLKKQDNIPSSSMGLRLAACRASSANMERIFSMLGNFIGNKRIRLGLGMVTDLATIKIEELIENRRQLRLKGLRGSSFERAWLEPTVFIYCISRRRSAPTANASQPVAGPPTANSIPDTGNEIECEDLPDPMDVSELDVMEIDITLNKLMVFSDINISGLTKEGATLKIDSNQNNMLDSQSHKLFKSLFDFNCHPRESVSIYEVDSEPSNQGSETLAESIMQKSRFNRRV